MGGISVPSIMPEGDMRQLRAVIGSLSVLAVAGCGGSSGTQPEEYPDVAGIWTGSIEGTNEFEIFRGTLTLNLTQNGQKLSGSYQLDGVVTGGISPGAAAATGPLVGNLSINSFDVPIRVTVYEPTCGTRGYALQGYFTDTTPQRVVLTGDILICRVGGQTYSVSQDTLTFQ
jgi:hypothetical protein